MSHVVIEGIKTSGNYQIADDARRECVKQMYVQPIGTTGHVADGSYVLYDIEVKNIAGYPVIAWRQRFAPTWSAASAKEWHYSNSGYGYKIRQAILQALGKESFV